MILIAFVFSIFTSAKKKKKIKKDKTKNKTKNKKPNPVFKIFPVLFLKRYFILCLEVICLYGCPPGVFSAPKGQEKAPDPLELEL